MNLKHAVVGKRVIWPKESRSREVRQFRNNDHGQFFVCLFVVCFFRDEGGVGGCDK